MRIHAVAGMEKRDYFCETKVGKCLWCGGCGCAENRGVVWGEMGIKGCFFGGGGWNGCDEMDRGYKRYNMLGYSVPLESNTSITNDSPPTASRLSTNHRAPNDSNAYPSSLTAVFTSSKFSAEMAQRACFCAFRMASSSEWYGA